MTSIIRKIKVLLRGFFVFPLREAFWWLGWRFGFLSRDNKERVFRIRRGEKFYFRPDVCSGAGFFQELYLQNHYFDTYRPKAGDVVFDIGAHIGIFSVIVVSSTKGVRLFAYEPSPVLFSLLQKNIRANSLQTIISSSSLGLGDHEGTVDFYATDGVSGSTTKEGAGGAPKAVTVQVTTLEDMFKKNNIERCDFLKMDCEGAEFSLLTWPAHVFQKISHIAAEYHLPPAALLARLRKEGFVTKLGPVLSNGIGMLYADKS